MMNPWDRERTYREEDGSSAAPSGGSGLLWLVSIVIAVVGLVLLAKNSSSSMVLVPIGISLFFMTMFWVSHRRESQAISNRRKFNQMIAHGREVEAGHHPADERLSHEVAPGTLYAPVQPVASVPSAVDANLRRVFDRFDLKVISQGRDWEWDAKAIASFLDYARDYVDTQHASSLLRANEKGELERHLDAAIERALVQHDIEHPELAKRKKSYGGYSAEEPPF